MYVMAFLQVARLTEEAAMIEKMVGELIRPLRQVCDLMYHVSSTLFMDSASTIQHCGISPAFHVLYNS